MTVDSPRFVLVTGLSGAGKSQALRLLEDIGYYCVDNLPASLICTIAELTLQGSRRRRVAVCIDVRAGEDLRGLPAYLDEITELGVRPEVLYLESSDDVLRHRYSESRRRHPAALEGTVEEGIQLERELLQPVRGRADLVLDTSAMTVAQLRDNVVSTFQAGQEAPAMLVAIESFGFKYGVPPEADLVFDVRFLPNPHYDRALRPLTGEDAPVASFVVENDTAREFLERTKGYLAFLLPRYIAEPKSYLTIAVGCTGGRHRSVAIARELFGFLHGLHGNVRLQHRDINRESPGA